ncbi:acyltransferase family protein [Mesorhizobium muleiense]|uniref:acyltransferase family protein n=1 Tax=Mesorhizobium muleiense TaxID=1004279 RepID=UPI001F28B547|nr:acyltransferase [Mesorhizobium muleiense]MCF6109004.1 acyltransferase [Mesorhizobium muleiense]
MTHTRISTASLDFLRGIAAVYVVVNHTRGAFFRGGERVMADAATAHLDFFDYIALSLLQLTSLGTEFVILFFCVSGVAMAHSINGSTNITRFYMKRMIRIWPSYAAAVALAGVACWTFAAISPGNAFSKSCVGTFCSITEIGRILLYISPGTVLTPQFWSLPYEVIFYALCPLLLATKARVAVVLALSVAFTIAGSLAYGIRLNPSSSIFVNFLICALFWFMCGAAAYHFISKVPALSPMAFYIVSIVTLAVALAIKKIVGDSNALSNFIMIIFTVNCVKNLPPSLYSRRFLNWGFFSYSIYIFHYAFVAMIAFFLDTKYDIQRADIHSYFAWIAAVPPILFGCWILYYCVEKHCNDYLSHLRSSSAIGGQIAAAP